MKSPSFFWEDPRIRVADCQSSKIELNESYKNIPTSLCLDVVVFRATFVMVMNSHTLKQICFAASAQFKRKLSREQGHDITGISTNIRIQFTCPLPQRKKHMMLDVKTPKSSHSKAVVFFGTRLA